MSKFLISGGCGFVGSNLAYSLLQDSHEVVAMDNLHRKGAEKNLTWLKSLNNQKFTFVDKDVTKPQDCIDVINGNAFDGIFHFAGQVAVTTSVDDPREDFNINAYGTFNMLEAVRLSGRKTPFFFTSTNKVYGEMTHINVVERENKWDYESLPYGAGEDQPLDFHSPYGCSKGMADQYVRDYNRIFGIPTVVFRMSCQFGPRQFGNEDQGWVAHFVIAACKGDSINIYGDGKQVRDILYIEDLIQVFLTAFDNIDRVRGSIFNIGGGRTNAISLLELVSMLENLTKRKIKLSYFDWRPGDQKVYISDIRKAKTVLGWEPKNSKLQGITKLYNWVLENHQMFGF